MRRNLLFWVLLLVLGGVLACSSSDSSGDDDDDDVDDDVVTCDIGACDADFDCQQFAEDAITEGDPICEGNNVSCMTCVDDCCEVTE